MIQYMINQQKIEEGRGLGLQEGMKLGENLGRNIGVVEGIIIGKTIKNIEIVKILKGKKTILEITEIINEEVTYVERILQILTLFPSEDSEATARKFLVFEY